MALLGLVSSCSGYLVKPLSLFSSACLRCIAVVPVKGFSTSEGPPKKPMNGYMFFAQQQRPVIVRQNPGFKIIEVTQKIAMQWRELTPEQKKPFEEASAAAKKQYNAEMERYKAQLSPSQAAALKEEKRQKLAKKEAVRKKRELTNLGKPKRPRTAVNIFMTEHFEEAEGKTMVEKSKALLDIWKSLNAAQKQVYLQLAQDDKIRYKDEIKSWEEHMQELGREDLIRRKAAGVKRQKEGGQGNPESNPLKPR
uniref:Transcription factor A, mitochondrial n=1 Tax=Paramormyrops kingsleyae TaxID=1676925 RepID=A0A3B3QVK2_9TELE